MGSYFSPIKDVLELTKSSGPVDVTPSSGLAPAVRQPLCQPSRGDDHFTPSLACREYISNQCLNLATFRSNPWQILKASRPGGALAGAGVCGRLGDLGCTSLPPTSHQTTPPSSPISCLLLSAAIDAAHDTALSTACGGLLDFIVVETAQGGAACVEFLRANNLGRYASTSATHRKSHHQSTGTARCSQDKSLLD